LLDVLEVLGVPEMMRCMLPRVLEAVEGGLCLLEVLKVPEMIRCVLLCMMESRLCL